MKRRPTTFPALGAPLRSKPCSCPVPDGITTGDKVRRCRRCAGTIEREPQLSDRWAA